MIGGFSVHVSRHLCKGGTEEKLLYLFPKMRGYHWVTKMCPGEAYQIGTTIVCCPHIMDQLKLLVPEQQSTKREPHASTPVPSK